MLKIVKVISTSFDKYKRRVVKVLKHGKSDVQTPDELSPFGIDSNPLKDMVAIYAESETKGEKFIVGYVLKDKLANPGETRLFSVNSNNVLQTYVWLKNDGTLLIGGDADFLARFTKLKEGFDQLKSDFNSLVTKYNSHVHSGVTTGGGSSGTVVPPNTGTSSTATIDAAKINNIKTP